MQGAEKSAKSMEETTEKSEPEPPTLPDNLILEKILPRLPVKPVTQFKLVSKYWLSSISSTKFAKNHLKYQSMSSDTKTLIYKDLICGRPELCCYLSLDENYNIKEFVNIDVKYHKNDNTRNWLTPNATHVIGSSNGLLCVFNQESSDCIIWNPVTNHYHNAGKPEHNKCLSWNPVTNQYIKPEDNEGDSDGLLLGVGFGYIPSIDDYRIGFLLEHFWERVYHVYVYSLKTGEWEEISCIKNGEEFFFNKPIYSVLVGDNIYWSPADTHHIVGLNLVSGHLMKYLLEGLLSGCVDAKVFEVKGCLALCRIKYVNGRRVSEVLSLNIDIVGKDYTCELMFSIIDMTLVHIFETGISLVTRYTNKIMAFDPSQQESRLIEEDDEGMLLWNRKAKNFYHLSMADVWNYIESLISPSALYARVVDEADGDEAREVVEDEESG